MSIVVTTPTGHIGSRVTQLLIQAGIRPTLLLRDPNKLSAELRERVDVRQGNLNDEAFVLEATQDAEALFWLIPSDYSSNEPVADIERIGAIGAKTVQANRISRTVFISSIGAERRRGTGFIDGLGRTEDRFDETDANVVYLRPGYFFTNLFAFADALKGGVLPTNFPLDLPMPWNDPRDIADVAAARLLAGDWTGRFVQAIHGPKHLTYTEVAQILSDATGRSIQALPITDEDERKSLLDLGMPEGAANAFVEMSQGLRSLEPQDPRTVVTTTPTTLGAWAYQNLRPILNR